MNIEDRHVCGVELKLTDDQVAVIKKFWEETGSLGRLEFKVDVVGDKISPASIQVGTAK